MLVAGSAAMLVELTVSLVEGDTVVQLVRGVVYLSLVAVLPFLLTPIMLAWRSHSLLVFPPPARSELPESTES